MARTRTDAACLLALGLIALGGLLAARPAEPAHARGATPYFGVSVNGVFRNGRLRPYSDELLQSIAGSNIRTGRTDAFWAWVEPQAPRNGRHTYRFDRTDTMAAAMAREGITWLPILDYSAVWASSVPGTDKAPPRGDGDFAAYAAAMARRYGPGGDFWRERPDLPALPVTTWEVWNEPNAEWFWKPAPDARRYASLYRAARDAIKAVDPQASVLVGGLVPGGADRYVADMYAARPDLRGRVEGVALHPYADRAEKVLTYVRTLRTALDEQGEEDVGIYVTEVGWPTQGEGDIGAPALPDVTRAAELTLAADALVKSDCDVRAFVPYTWVSPERNEDYDADWFGMYNHDLTATQTSAAYAADISRQQARAGAAAAGEPSGEQLRVCERLDADEAADRLRLSLSVGTRASGGERCYDAVVTYRGRPLHYVAVLYEYTSESRASGRRAYARTTKARTGDDGKATWCTSAVSDDGYRREVAVTADIPRAAVSSTVVKGVR